MEDDIFTLIAPRPYFKDEKGVKISPVNTHFETDEVINHIMKILIDHRKFTVSVAKYKADQKIDKYSGQTKWFHNPDLLVAMDVKYFPKLETINDSLGAITASFITDTDHVYIVTKIFNERTKEYVNHAWVLCPSQICFDKIARQIFFHLSGLAVQKRRQGKTNEDKEKIITHLLSYDAYKVVSQVTIGELRELVFRDGYKMYGVFSDGFTTLPINSLYAAMEQTFGYSFDRCHFDPKLFEKRLTDGMTETDKPIIKNLLKQDMDNCRHCIKYFS